MLTSKGELNGYKYAIYKTSQGYVAKAFRKTQETDDPDYKIGDTLNTTKLHRTMNEAGREIIKLIKRYGIK